MANNSDRKEETPADNPADSQTSILRQVRGPLLEAAGLAGLVVIIGTLFGASNTITAALATFFVIVWVIASLGRKYFKEVSIILLSVFCFVLATSLALAWHSSKDRWREWDKVISASLKECPPGRPCIATALAHDYPEPQPPSKRISNKLGNDLKAGSYLLQNSDIKKILEDYLGINDRFLGTGFSLRYGTDEYEDARIPEYLCPNRQESADDVITWHLSPKRKYMEEWTVEEIIRGERIVKEIIKGKEETRRDVLPEDSNDKDSKDKVDKLHLNIEKMIDLDLSSKKPAVVRFQQLLASSGKVGYKDRSRVFFSHLGAVWRMKLKDAATYSGYPLDSAEGEKKIFIWVFLPTHETEVVPATWKNIITYIKDEKNPWIK